MPCNGMVEGNNSLARCFQTFFQICYSNSFFIPCIQCKPIIEGPKFLCEGNILKEEDEVTCNDRVYCNAKSNPIVDKSFGEQHLRKGLS